MDLQNWDERYRTEDQETAAPTSLLVETASRLPPGKALDLACGTGRNALWLAHQGWQVTAVDGSQAAIEILRRKASASIKTQVADLERGEYRIEPATWDLIAMCYYLQRDLFEPAKQGLVPGGIVLAIVHITEPGEEPTRTRARPGELATFFHDCQILHYYEGKPKDEAHRRAAAAILARRQKGD
jgi:tellurite methyltransferase